jgi:hypothetical protein
MGSVVGVADGATNVGGGGAAVATVAGTVTVGVAVETASKSARTAAFPFNRSVSRDRVEV